MKLFPFEIFTYTVSLVKVNMWLDLQTAHMDTIKYTQKYTIELLIPLNIEKEGSWLAAILHYCIDTQEHSVG